MWGPPQWTVSGQGLSQSSKPRKSLLCVMGWDCKGVVTAYHLEAHLQCWMHVCMYVRVLSLGAQTILLCLRRLRFQDSHPILAPPTIGQSPGPGARPGQDTANQQSHSYLGWLSRGDPELA